MDMVIVKGLPANRNGSQVAGGGGHETGGEAKVPVKL
jgi:hypothetical protein